MKGIVELKTLRYFVAVAEELHFGRAAKRVHISQPPLSRQIQNLERELGTVLLRRTNRRVELTPAGEMYLRQIIPILNAIGDAASAARRAERGEIGRLVIGFFLGATDRLLPPILRRFRTLAPKVEIILREMGIPEMPQSLVERVIDIGFVRPPVVNASISTEVLLSEPFVAALPKEHRLARKRQLKLLDLALEPFIMYPSGRTVLPEQIIGACHRVGFSPRVVQRARYPDTLIGLVASGAGVALVPSSVQLRGRIGVEFRNLTGPLPKAEIAMAWRRDDTSPLVNMFLDTARTTVVKRSLPKGLKRT